jgi:transcriptional regulator with XRE-family HTH domain
VSHQLIDEMWRKLSFGRKIIRLRCLHRITEDSFASAVGVAPGTVGRWEKGAGNATLYTEKISKVLRFDFVNFIATEQYKSELSPEELRRLLVGEAIRKYRSKRKMSQSDLAQEVGVIKKAISWWENGSVSCDMAYKEKLDRLFGVTIFSRSDDVPLDDFEKHLVSDPEKPKYKRLKTEEKEI